jgi:plastocyanin
VVTVTVAPSPTPTLVEATDEVIIIGFSFYPGDIVVPAGATVTWTNQDAEEHTVTSDAHTGSFDEDILFGNSFSYTFTERGIYKYHCHNHDEMRGTVIVE